MIGIHTVERIRTAEQEFAWSHPGANLMLQAASAIARRAEAMAPTGTILVVAGPGDNGGDGLFAARGLALAGRHVIVWLTVKATTTIAATVPESSSSPVWNGLSPRTS